MSLMRIVQEVPWRLVQRWNLERNLQGFQTSMPYINSARTLCSTMIYPSSFPLCVLDPEHRNLCAVEAGVGGSALREFSLAKS